MILNVRLCKKFLGRTFIFRFKEFTYVGQFCEVNTNCMRFKFTTNNICSYLHIFGDNMQKVLGSFDFEIIGFENSVCLPFEFPLKEEKW